MLRKTLTAVLAALLLAGTVAAASAAASAKPGQARMTICHHPGHDGTKTMEIPESAWKGHREHGDHEGACTAADRAGAAPERPQVPRTPLSLSAKGDGDVDGDATFRVVVRNPGKERPVDVAVEGTLTGEGRWTVEGDSGRCAVNASQRLRCAFGDLPAGQGLGFRIRFDGPVSVCEEATVTLALSAANDASAGDDRVRETVQVGACSPFERPAASGPLAVA